MKIIVTGASGFIGQQLVPLLVQAGHELLLVGRDTARLGALFAEARTCSYDRLTPEAAGFDVLVHLAVQNNDAQVDDMAFQSVNVDLFGQVIDAAKAAAVPHFLNITSFHALDEGKTDGYARSKRKALALARATQGISVTNVFLPAVYGDRFAGKLSMLNNLPTVLQRAGLPLLAALAPTVHVTRLAEFIARSPSNDFEDVFLAEPQRNNPAYRFGRGILDYGFVFGVILLLPVLLVIWGLIRAGSTGPGIFSQDRVGRDARTFVCHKFRTMQTGTKQVGTHEVSAASVTKIGAFLRKTKLDEFPQALNILRGEISFVGPRPCLPGQVELIEERKARGVFEARPGITGLAQINGVDMSEPKRLARWDAMYIARQSLLLDIKIFIGTFIGQGLGDKVRG